MKSEGLSKLLFEIKVISKKYFDMTGRPLGTTGEIAELEAAHILELNLAVARQAGYDAIDKSGRKIQIKGRRIDNKKQNGRLGSVDITKEFDVVYLVLLDESNNAFEIFEASREDVVNILIQPGSKSRNERNQMSVSKFKSIGKQIWVKPKICTESQ